MDGVHDLGGMAGFGPVVRPGSEATHVESWEVRAQAVGLMSGTVNRPLIEGLPPAQYLSSSYYARWLSAAEIGAVADGLVEPSDLERWFRHFAADAAAEPPRVEAPGGRGRIEVALARCVELPSASNPRFAVGDRVRVIRRRRAHHHRCPRYVQGVVGVVERVCFDDHVPPEETAGPTEAVYTVEFASVDLWGPTDEPAFSLCVDLWQSYLEAA